MGTAGNIAGSAARIASTIAAAPDTAGKGNAGQAGNAGGGGGVGRGVVTPPSSGAGSGVSNGTAGGAGRAEAGSAAPMIECTPGQKSTPRSAADPCQQDHTACSSTGGIGVASCGADSAWGQCICELPTTSTPLRQNGATCAVSKDCASGICEKSNVGELHCYGTGVPNDPCRDVFDCHGGVCIGKTSDTSAAVCVDGISACADLGLIGTCTANLAIATCQLDELCDSPKSRLDFNSCVRYGCGYWHDNPPTGGCPGQLSFARGGTANCPKP
jgi:hypothetical protein